MIRVILQDCHLRLRKYRQRIDEEKEKCFEFMNENGTKLLQQRVAERARDHKAKREVAQVTDETKYLIRQQVSSLLMARRPPDAFSKVNLKALKEFRADIDLVIVPTDTGAVHCRIVLAVETFLLLLREKNNETENRLGYAQIL
ncbi:unnamed protein product [Dibothriocephalus latus]|uniref:Uncharacterized protein n=1 Tax=Dibothriocephalus latus TaxID=60516 RepID=A0A3P7PUI8_DIBLA|nr:unnamed protein product [Dibothriocephalus latus]